MKKRYEVNVKGNNVTVRDKTLGQNFFGKLIDGKLSANSSVELKMVWKGLKENGIECE